MRLSLQGNLHTPQALPLSLWTRRGWEAAAALPHPRPRSLDTHDWSESNDMAVEASESDPLRARNFGNRLFLLSAVREKKGID